MSAHTLDRRGEEAAALTAERQGARVLARNWRGGGGELDLVLEWAGVLVFCEVKTRASDSMGSGFEAVTEKKQRRITRAALAFLAARGIESRPCRFDVACVEPAPSGDRCRVVWMQGAFPAAEELEE